MAADHDAPRMLWPVTVHRVADRHGRLHEREFAVTKRASVFVTTLGDAVLTALAEVGLDEAAAGSYRINVGWPYEEEAGDAR